MSQLDSRSADDDEELVNFGEAFEETTDFGGGGLDSAVMEPAGFESAGAEEPVAEEGAPEEFEEEGGEEEEAAPKKKRGVVLYKPKANIYTMMMLVSFVALVIGCLCLWGELQQYGGVMRPPR